MIEIIRMGVFETNSSMSHSLIVMPRHAYDLWKESGLYYYSGHWIEYEFKDVPEDKRPVKGSLYTRDEVIAFLKIAGVEYEYDEEEYYTFDRYLADVDYTSFVSYEGYSEDEYLECETNYYTTQGGEELAIVCQYGRDG